jgi:hypothetical protein
VLSALPLYVTVGLGPRSKFLITSTRSSFDLSFYIAHPRQVRQAMNRMSSLQNAFDSRLGRDALIRPAFPADLTGKGTSDLNFEIRDLVYPAAEHLGLRDSFQHRQRRVTVR